MKAVEISRPGGPDVLVPVERPMPEPGPGEVLIKVSAAGINRPDVFQRKGAYPPRARRFLPGLEVAGEIVSGDAAAGGLAIGDKVCALVAGGGYAEYCVAPAASACRFRAAFPTSKPPACPKPTSPSGATCSTAAVWPRRGAAGPWRRQRHRHHGHPAGPRDGQPGHATVGSDERARAVEALGAARGINYKTQDFVKEVLDATGGRGVDVVLDMVAGDYIGRDIQCLADDGRIVIIAQLGGAHANVDTAQVMRRRLTITGSTLRPRPWPSRAPLPARCASAPGRCWSRAPSSRSSTPPSRWPRPPRPAP